MKQAARAHEPNEVILTAADINALIAANRKSSGMASVGINGNVASGANFHSAGKIGRSISRRIWSGRSVFERHCHDCSAAGDQREQRAVERSENQWPQLSHRSAGWRIIRSRTVAAKLCDQICQPVWSDGRRNQGRQSNLAHQRPLILPAPGARDEDTHARSHTLD